MTLYAFCKAELCEQGDRCKLSRDPDVERKGEESNAYDDTREQDNSGALRSALPFASNSSTTLLCSRYDGEQGLI